MRKRRKVGGSVGLTLLTLLILIASRLDLFSERPPIHPPVEGDRRRETLDDSRPRAASAATQSPEPFGGRVTRVSDGDSLTVKTKRVEHRVRLHGIDCPELAQEYGQSAKRMTHRLCHGRHVDVVPVGRDQYDRILGEVFVGGQSLNRELLMAGLAWVYGRHEQEQEWKGLERAARGQGRGLWAESRPTPPWRWRKANPRQ